MSRIATDAAISVRVTLVPIGKSARVLNVLRTVLPNLTLHEYRTRLDAHDTIGPVDTYRNDLDQYLEVLRALCLVDESLRADGVEFDFELHQSQKLVTFDDLFETTSFHSSYRFAESLEIASLLSDLSMAEWLSAVGSDIADNDIQCVPMPHAIDPAFKYLIVGLQNAINAALCERQGFHHCCIQSVYAALLPRVRSMSQERLFACFEVPEDSADTISSIILLACVELHFSQMLTQTHAIKWVKWIIQGHLVCGWLGVFPNGKLCVA